MLEGVSVYSHGRRRKNNTNDDHIGGGSQAFNASGEVLCDLRNASHDQDGELLDAVGMGVLLLPSRKYAPNAKVSI